MTKQSPIRAMLWILLTMPFLPGGKILAQDCAEPALVCPLASTDTISSSEGIPSPLPPGFCFDEAPNALFFMFETLDLVQFPGITFDDSTAFLTLLIDSCVTDSLYTEGLSFAVFEAEDLCDSGTYDSPIACVQEVTQSGQLVLDNLLPTTTYYVVVTGFFEDTLNAIASDCAFRLSVSGPAVEYDISATPPTPQNQSIFPGQTAMLALNPDFEPYEWQGESLNAQEGASVIAAPTDFGVYTYSAQTEIKECPVQRNFLVSVVPPITPFNAFTPNNDGFNDTWEIDRIQEFQNAQIIVYSRWGSKVFQATNYKNNWDGDNLPAATYYYVIELNDPDNFDAPPITGSVTIIR